MFETLLALLGPGIRTAAPILLAAVGGYFTHRAGIFNIGLDGFMLSAAFAAVLTASITGSPMLGLACGVIVAILVALLKAVLVLHLQADEIIVGIAINLLAIGLTAYLLQELTGGSSVLQAERGLPRLSMPWLAGVPILGSALYNQSVLVLVALLAVPVVHVISQHTAFGSALRAVGENPDAARSAGIDVIRTKYWSYIWCGAFCGLGGSQLALGALRLFSIDMTAGRGIIAFGAVIFGGAAIAGVSFAALLFGLSEAVGNRLQTTDTPPQLVLMLPYFATILVLLIPSAKAKLAGARARQRRSRAVRTS
jgi:simple sugar transport system permease protein